MKKNNHIILILSFLCIFSVSLMIVGLCKNEKEKVEFVPPQFDDTVKDGVPPTDEADDFGWAEISQEGMPYKTAICGNILIFDENAIIYFTNYAENNVWLKLRILDNGGNIVAETGLAKPGEYIETVRFSRPMETGEKIKLKIMAYEPDTYYSVGSVVLSTTVRTGE